MTKKQKIWLAVFGAMFLVPEVLWGPIFGLWSINKKIFDLDNRFYLTLIVLLQFIGCTGLTFIVYRFKKFKNILYWLALLFLLFCILRSGYLLYLFYAVKDISF
jgi:hypothetical protein